MKLHECLTQASVNTLRSIAIQQELDCSLYSKLDMMETILYNLRVKTILTRQVDTWLNQWQEVLRRLVLMNRTTFSNEEIQGIFSSAEQSHGVEVALTQGWLFAQNNRRSRIEYIMPDEIYTAIRTRFKAKWTDALTIRTAPPLIQEDEAFAIIGDAQTMIEYVLHHDVRLTTGGAMYKRHVQQIMELFQVQEDLELPEWRFGYGRRAYDYPDRFALIYDYLHDAGIFHETPEGLLQVTDQVDTWRTADRRVQLQRILHFYLRMYRRPIPRLRDIVEVLRIIGDQWVSSTSVRQICSGHVQAFYYDTETDVWNKRIIRMLKHLGMLCCGQDQESDETWFQMTKLGQELLTQDAARLPEETNARTSSLIVQPNFEVMVTVPGTGVEAVLAEFADLSSSGSLRIYRILERTVYRGLAKGYNIRRFLEVLQKSGIGPVPGNVERTIGEWVVRFQDTTLSS